MNHAVPIDDGVAVGGQRAAQGDVGIEVAGLIEVNNAQPVGAANSPPVGAISPCSRRNSVVLPLPLGPTRPTRIPAVRMKFRFSKSGRSPMAQATFSSSIRRLVLRSVAEKSICAVAVRVRDSGRPVRDMRSPALLMRAFDLRVRALAPRRSHSISLWTRFSSASCRLACAWRNSSFFSRKCAVVSVDAKKAVGINAVEFDHLGGDVLEKIAVVADDHAGEGRALKQVFEPGDSREIEMVGGLVEQQNVGMLHQSFGDGQTLAPASGEFVAWASKSSKPARPRVSAKRAPRSVPVTAARSNAPSMTVRMVSSGREPGILLDVAETGALAHGDFAGVGVDLAGENAEQRGFTGAVGADQADAISFGNGERNFLEERIGAEGFRDFLGVDYRWQACGLLRLCLRVSVERHTHGGWTVRIRTERIKRAGY